MSHWPFVWAAYGVTLTGVATLTVQSWCAMRRAEAEAERHKR
jgi:heme exporter protein CcmD